MKRKQSINKRIISGFLFVLILTFLITALVYSVFSKQFIIRQTRSDLRSVAQTAEERFTTALEKSAKANYRNLSIRLASDLFAFNEVLGTNTVVLDREGEVVLPRQGMDKAKLSDIIKTGKLNDAELIIYNHRITNEDIPYKNFVMFKRYTDVKALRNVGYLTLFISFGIGLIVALVLSISLSQKIYKPIKILKENMHKYMTKKAPVSIYESNDEIEELSVVFKALTDKINRLDDRQKQFFQNSSHELKTPLMSIQGYVEAIKDGIVSEEEMDHSLDIIISETQRLKNIVDDVIYLSKIDSLEDQFIMDDHYMCDIINDAVAVVMPLIKANKLTLEVNCDDEIVLKCDYNKIKRVFINLISNGSRYAKTKMVVNVHKHEKHLMIDVIDDGEGFEYGKEETVFDRFVKGEKGGSGIGLALTKEIIEKHGGQIKAINHMNYGAIFKIEFEL